MCAERGWQEEVGSCSGLLGLVSRGVRQPSCAMRLIVGRERSSLCVLAVVCSLCSVCCVARAEFAVAL